MQDAASLRRAMVDEQIIARGISNPRVIAAMLRVPRHRFVPEAPIAAAYADGPWAIGAGQTISQPYIVALMIELADVAPGARILEIGAGSGYAAAVMGEIAAHVTALERLPELADRARATIRALGYDNIDIIAADGMAGWPSDAPYDAILVPAGAARLPPALPDQLAPGGRLVMPIGGRFQQQLTRFTRSADGTLTEEHHGGVMFVPLIGAEGA
ncbi:protein-L-isoaspartate(D-aspartate) O-methyltransferase [Sphingomonas laterariae]|uniref:Protein-L-isoaspartate O-methyltransferase n=1 Tax=Edaphosphingomonas laterariae TaxID=861865 RepID=A0A239EJC7_9SPHN|nr:protein-L-isoaspartate(D-aspartate) O-methyltransferase [Sphingomonas laterariae]SNS44727.1 protein-L-isoaspartate(D-aspartate) O-methyltransferase [Sphingomonas laterariae]